MHSARKVNSRYAGIVPVGLWWLMILLLSSLCASGRQNPDNVRANNYYQQACRVCGCCTACRSDTLPRAGVLLCIGSNTPEATAFHNAHILIRQQQYNEALPYVLYALGEGVRTGNDTMQYYACLMHATIYQHRKLPDETMASLKKALKIAGGRDLPLLPQAYCDIATVLFRQKQYRSSLDYNKLVEQKWGHAGDSTLLRTLYNNIAIDYLYLEIYPEAARYHYKSLGIEQALHDTAGIAASYLNLGDLFFEQYKDDSAIYYWRKSLHMARVARSLELQENACRNLSLAMESKHRYQEALDHYKQSVTVKDSIWNRDKIWQLAQQEKKIAVALKQQELLVMEQRSLLQASELKRRGWQRNALLGFAFLLLLVIFLIYYVYRQKVADSRIIAAQKKLLEELIQTKDKLFSVVAHDLRAPVATLRQLQLQLADQADTAGVQTMLQPVTDMKQELDSFQLLLDNLLQWVWIQTDRLYFNREKLHLHTVAEMVVYDFAAVLQRKHLTIQNDIPPALHVLADYTALKVLLRNIVSNAVKHTVNGHIFISATVVNARIQLEIRDTGKGIPAAVQPYLFGLHTTHLSGGTAGEPATGLGLWLCKYLVERNGGDIFIESSEDTGTRVFILLEALI